MAITLGRAVSVSGLMQRIALVFLAAMLGLPADTSAQERRSVIVTAKQGRVDALAARYGAIIRKRLKTGAVLEVPSHRLPRLAAEADDVDPNQIVHVNTTIAVATTGADQLQAGLPAFGIPGLSGKGVGIAVIDTGVAWAPELRYRVAARKDFTSRRGRGWDWHGHGTHVAGIIAASGGRRSDLRGMAPGAHVVSLKVLDANGEGYASEVIEAIDWAIANAARYRLRAINLSLGGSGALSWRDDPICDAVTRAHDAGLVVVASAGNFGKTADGKTIFGAITTPGHCPHAITVGALNAKGTAFRSDDVMATYSSRGPTLVDRLIKPDVAAPGNRILGLLAPRSTLAREHPELVIDTVDGKRLELSGTSMAAAVVSGATALLLDWHRGLAPAGVRLLLQATATLPPGAPLLAAGAGSINVLAAVTGPLGESSPVTSVISGETVTASAMAFGSAVLKGEPVFEAGYADSVVSRPASSSDRATGGHNGVHFFRKAS